MSPKKKQHPGAEQVHDYMGYEIAEIGNALDPKLIIPNWKDIVTGFTKYNEAARRTHTPKTFSYADHGRAVLDLYDSGVPAGAPALIFFHGGGFNLLSKDDMAFVAPAFNAAGVAYIAPSYPLAPEASLAELLSYTQRAAKWIYENAEKLRIDRERLYISGASAGGFISAYLLTTDWTHFGLPRSIFKGGLPLNAVYDAKPLYLSPCWNYLGIRPEQVEALSPISRMSALVDPILVAWAEDEPPLLRASSHQFSNAARERGLLVETYVAPYRNHFNMVLDLVEPQSVLFRKMADMITAAGPGEITAR